MSQDTFQVEGFEFRLSHLPVLDSLDLLPKVLATFPSLAQAAKAKADGNDLAGLVALRGLFAQARPLVEAFLGVCQMRTTTDGGASPHFQPMRDVYSHLLSRQQMLLLTWAHKCVQLEYGDFLSKARPSQKPTAPASS
jgi:hypothetical protein